MYFVLMIVLPVVSFAFFALLFNQGAIRNIPIAVLDQDNTTLSRKAVQMIDDTPTAMVAYGIQGMDEGERLMREGRIMAIVQIPAFFEKNILSNSQTRLENYVSGTNITVNGLLSKDIQTAVTTFTAGIQLQVLMKQGLTRAAGHGAADARALRQARTLQSAHQLRLLPLAEFHAHDAADLRGHGDRFSPSAPNSSTPRPASGSARRNGSVCGGARGQDAAHHGQ